MEWARDVGARKYEGLRMEKNKGSDSEEDGGGTKTRGVVIRKKKKSTAEHQLGPAAGFSTEK